MTSNTTLLLVIGVFFAIIGLLVLLVRKRNKAAGLIPLIIGAAAIYLATIGPLSNSQEQINRIVQIDKRTITKISIIPLEQGDNEQSGLNKSTVEITDKQIIDSLLQALTRSTVTNSIIKNPNWVCLVRLDRSNGSFFEFEVRNAGNYTNIEVRSAGKQGWNYGTLDARHFGKLLTNIVNTPRDTIKTVPANQIPASENWMAVLLKNYITHSGKELIRLAIQSKAREEWLFDQVIDTDTAKYYVFHIGHEVSEKDGSELRFITDQWIYIDSLTRKLYEYDLPNERLIRWEK